MPREVSSETDIDPVSIFGAAGVERFRRVWPDYEPRPQQERMAGAVHSALRDGRSLLVEAGTGVGKTLAYLLPLLEYGEREDVRVVVSTETRSLQQQILEKDLPTARKILGRDIPAELCLGASNYVCKRRLAGVLDEGSFGPEMMDSIEEFLAWEKRTETGVRHEYTGPASPEFWRKIGRDPDDCLGGRCPNFDVSYYFLAKRRWQDARLLVVNHSLLSYHFAYGRRLLPEFSHVVVDEAHRFPEIFHGAFAEAASFREMQIMITELGRKGHADESRAFESFRDALIEALPLKPGENLRCGGAGLELAAGRDFVSALDRGQRYLKQKLQQLSQQQQLSLGDSEDRNQTNVDAMEVQALSNRLSRVTSLVNTLLDGAPESEDRVFWLSRAAEERRRRRSSKKDRGERNDAPDYRLQRAPLYPGALIRRNFLKEVRTVVFTSATLTTRGGAPRETSGNQTKAETIHPAFAYFAREIGCDDGGDSGEVAPPLSLQLDSPFDYRRRALLYLPRDMPDPAREEERFHQAAAREIERLLLLSRGGAFVLFTSGRSLRAVQALMSGERRYAGDEDDHAAYEIINQLEHGASTALLKFLQAERGALFGLATFWQGIDIAGDRLRLVILVRLPFRVPDEPLLAARMEREKESGGDPFRSLQLPAAVISIKQGFGRLIRTHNDRGIVAILDPRIRTKNYGKGILRALPPARIAASSFEEMVQIRDELFGD